MHASYSGWSADVRCVSMTCRYWNSWVGSMPASLRLAKGLHNIEITGPTNPSEKRDSE